MESIWQSEKRSWLRYHSLDIRPSNTAKRPSLLEQVSTAKIYYNTSEILFLFTCYNRVFGQHPLLSICVKSNKNELGETKEHNDGFKEEGILLGWMYGHVYNVKNK